MKSKRGQGLPMNTIVIAALVLVVLVVMIMIFTGSMGNWLSSLKNETEGKDCIQYKGEKAASWVGGTICPPGEIPIYNTRDADVYPGQTCCLEPVNK